MWTQVDHRLKNVISDGSLDEILPSLCLRLPFPVLSFLKDFVDKKRGEDERNC